MLMGFGQKEDEGSLERRSQCRGLAAREDDGNSCRGEGLGIETCAVSRTELPKGHVSPKCQASIRGISAGKW